MTRKLIDLMNMEQVKGLLDSLSDLTGTAHSLVDAHGQILSCSGWQDICRIFHHQNPATEERCRQSVLQALGQPSVGQTQAGRCLNGLMLYSVPIFVDELYLATLFFSQFLHEPPDEAFFIRQAKDYGFDEETYLAALRRVPVIPLERANQIMTHFVRVAELPARVNLEKVRLLDEARQDLEAMTAARRQAEKYLQDLENRYQAVLTSMTDPACRFLPDGTITLLNDACNQYFNLSGKNLIGSSLFEILPEKFLKKVKNAVTELMAGLETAKIEQEITQADGQLCWVEWVLHPLFRDDRFVEVQAVGRDVTKRRQKQKLRDKSHKARFRAVFEQAPIGIALLHLPSLKLSRVNHAGRQMVGYSEAELRTMTPRDLTGPGEWKKYLQAWNHARKTGKNFFQLEGRLTHKEDRFVPTNVTVSIVRGDSGRPTYLICMMEDITEKKRAEEALKRSEGRYRRITSAMTDYIFTVYLDGNQVVRTEHSPACEAVTGYRPEELNPDPMSWLDLIPEEDRGQVVAQVNLLSLKQEFRSIKHRFIRKDGRIIWVRNTPVPHFDSQGNLIEYDTLLSDITDRQQAEEIAREEEQLMIQQDKLASLGTLAAGMAHEINNPTSFIMLNAPILGESWDDIQPILEEYERDQGDFSIARLPYSKMRNYMPLLVKGISEGAERISNIVKTLKDYARPDFNDQTQLVDLNQVVTSALVLLTNLIKHQTEALSVNYCSNLPQVLGNYQRLEQVVINLVQNACQALPSKDRGVSIVTGHDPLADMIFLTVEDQGEGIDKENLPHVFDPFFTTKRTRGGTGLGLSICQTIVAEHRGRLELNSKVGRGTIAKMILPVWKAK
ncbi:MAG: PAS domain S-box protein [Deltaproteobacteria bacterium]|nr:PAS domain S-box protein [Deltaproteobacteria bacterium]